jgi:hypothetical protein
MTNNSFEILLVYQYARFKNYPGSWFASVLSVSLPSCQSFKMKSADFLNQWILLAEMLAFAH